MAAMWSAVAGESSAHTCPTLPVAWQQMEAGDGRRAHPVAGLEPLLSIADVQAVLRISESGVYRLMRSGDLAAVRIGGCTRFEPAAVRELIVQRTVVGGSAEFGEERA
jgi:hypothetical protein